MRRSRSALISHHLSLITHHFPFRSQNSVSAARGAARDARFAEDFGAQKLAVDDKLLIAELPVLARQLGLRAVPLRQKVRAVAETLGLGLVAGLAQKLGQTPRRARRNSTLRTAAAARRPSRSRSRRRPRSGRARPRPRRSAGAPSARTGRSASGTAPRPSASDGRRARVGRGRRAPARARRSPRAPARPGACAHTAWSHRAPRPARPHPKPRARATAARSPRAMPRAPFSV